MRKIILILILFFKPVSAMEFEGKFIQGSFILGKTKPNTKVEIDNKKIRVSKEGFFAFGIGRDRKIISSLSMTTMEKNIIEKKS